MTEEQRKALAAMVAGWRATARQINASYDPDSNYAADEAATADTLNACAKQLAAFLRVVD